MGICSACISSNPGLRKNPHVFVGERNFSREDLKKVARSIEALEQVVYADTGMYEAGYSGFLDTMSTEDVKYSAVVYDTDSGGSELGPYVGYLIIYTVTQGHEDFNAVFNSASGYMSDSAIANARRVLNEPGREVIFIYDIAREMSKRGAQEYSKLYEEVIRKAREKKAGLIVYSRAETCYKAIKRLERDGALDVLLETPLDNYHDGERIFHVAACFK